MKHLVSVDDLSKDEALALLDLAAEMSAVNLREIKKLPSLTGKTVANMFFEDSTRTRISFEIAAKRLSADVVSFAAKGSSVSKGESLKDTVLTLEAMGVDAIVVRHNLSGAAQTIAEATWSQASIVNAGDGTHEHPTQALLDAFSIRSSFFASDYHGDLAGLRVLITGDILHSRVARSNAMLLRKLGASVSFCGPSTLVPDSVKPLADFVFHDFDEALETQFDVVMMLRMQNERMESSFVPNATEYSEFYGLTKSRFDRLKSDVRIMHPGPMNRGLEISSLAADSANSLITTQVTNGVAMRMAVLYTLLAQEGKEK